LTIPWVPVGAKARKGIAFEPAGDQTLDPFARATLLTAIARARCWMDDLVEGRVSSFQEIAESEGKVERHLRCLAPLAYLCTRRSNHPSLERPDIPVASE
jgi:site-specific DNA recombinase